VGRQRRRLPPGWPPRPRRLARCFAGCIKTTRLVERGLSADQVARIVQRRAKLAGLDVDWAAHSLRSGYVTEAGRQGVALGDVMAMTEHRTVSTVMGYFQAGSLLSSLATSLLGMLSHSLKAARRRLNLPKPT
jgi:hypothetical protein